MQVYLAWLKLVFSLFKVARFYLNLAIIFCIAFIFFLFIHLVSFANNYWYKSLQALYPEVFISSFTEPEINGFSFERHLVSRNLNLSFIPVYAAETLEANPAITNASLYLPDLRLRTASPKHLAQFIYPSPNEIYLTQPLYIKLQELNLTEIGFMNFAKQQVNLQPRLIPLTTQERWAVLAPETAIQLKDLGPSLMQQWLPLSNKSLAAPNKAELNYLAKQAAELEVRYETWQDLLPLASRLSFTLFSLFSSCLALIFITFSGIFVSLFIKSLVADFKTWLNFAAFYVSSSQGLLVCIATSLLLLSGLVLLAALGLEMLLAQEISRYLPNSVIDIWLASAPNYLWLSLSGLVGVLLALVLKFTWRKPQLAFWQAKQV